jgi:hypothetical protein
MATLQFRHGTRAAGAQWGFGSRDELARAGVTLMCRSPDDLADTVRDPLTTPPV